MAKFCTRCGRPIGECVCGASAPQNNRYREPSSYSSYGAMTQSHGVRLCSRCGQPEGQCRCGAVGNMPNAPQNTERMSAKSFFSFTQVESRKKADSYEKGKRIVPELIAPCEGERPIKQYEVGRVRKRLGFSRGYCRIAVTNKRVIHRSVGRSLFSGKSIRHEEFDINSIGGLNFEKGKQLSFADFILTWLLCAVVALIGFFFGSLSWGLSLLFTLLIFGIWAYLRFRQRIANNVVFAMLFALGWSVWMPMTPDASFLRHMLGIRFRSDRDFPEEIAAVLIVITGLLFFIYLFRSAILPAVSVYIKAKVPSDVILSSTANSRISNFKLGAIVLPGRDTEQTIREIGAVIEDVQVYGDRAVDKWAENTRRY